MSLFTNQTLDFRWQLRWSPNRFDDEFLGEDIGQFSSIPPELRQQQNLVRGAPKLNESNLKMIQPWRLTWNIIMVEDHVPFDLYAICRFQPLIFQGVVFEKEFPFPLQLRWVFGAFTARAVTFVQPVILGSNCITKPPSAGWDYRFFGTYNHQSPAKKNLQGEPWNPGRSMMGTQKSMGSKTLKFPYQHMGYECFHI